MSQSSESDESDQRFSDSPSQNLEDNNSDEYDIDQIKQTLKRPKFDNPEDEEAFNLYLINNGNYKTYNTNFNFKKQIKKMITMI